MAPSENFDRHRIGSQAGCIEHMDGPAALALERAAALPVHLLPTVDLQHLGFVAWVGGMAAHPVRESDVVHEQRQIVATGGQPGYLNVPGEAAGALATSASRVTDVVDALAI